MSHELLAQQTNRHTDELIVTQGNSEGRGESLWSGLGCRKAHSTGEVTARLLAAASRGSAA